MSETQPNPASPEQPPRKEPAQPPAESGPIEVEAQTYDKRQEARRVVDAPPGGAAPPRETSKPPTSSGASGSAENSRGWAVMAHLSTLIGFVIAVGMPVPNFVSALAPFVVWQILEPGHAFAVDQAKEAFNFQVNVMGWTLLAWALTLTCCLACVGAPLLFLIPIWTVVMTIVAAVRAAQGVRYRYPLTLRVVGAD
jgi:uncharacterized Tic20 family protein